MILYVHQDNKRFYTTLLDQLFRKRYEVFKLGYNWDIPTYDNYEMDEYDNHYASYLIYIDQMGDIIGSVRLNPTSHTSMVQDHFRDYCYPELPVDQRLVKLPRRPDVLEVTRFFCRPKDPTRIGYFTKETLELVAATIELALELEVTALLSILEQSWWRMFQKLKWQLEDIGCVPAPKNQAYRIVLMPIHWQIYNYIIGLIGASEPLINERFMEKKDSDHHLYKLMKMKMLATIPASQDNASYTGI